MLFLWALLALQACPASPAHAEDEIPWSCDRISRRWPEATIDEIVIDHRPILEGSEPGLPAWFPHQMVNRLHIDTSEEVIRSELLFAVGQRLDPERIRETRRNLRERDYFRDESMECQLDEDGRVRVTVSVRENWSLIPLFDIQGVDENHSVTVGLTEQNLLGQGKTLSASFRSGAEGRNTFIENTWRLSYSDPNILGSRYRMAWLIQGQETGERLTARLERPYYSLETPWAGEIYNDHYRRKGRLIRNGVVAAEFERQDNLSSLTFGVALKRGPPVVHRIESFYEYDQKRIRDFVRLPGAPPVQRPADETLSLLGLGYRRLGVHYITEKRIRQFERHEDFNIANDLQASASFSASALGADRDQWILRVSDAQGHAFREGHFFQVEASAEGWVQGDEIRNGLVFFNYDHYLRDTCLDLGPILHTFHWLGSFGHGKNLDSDRLLFLGFTNGLRGYSRAAFTGNKLLLLSAEDRVFLAPRILGLLKVGFLFFADAGYVWSEGREMDLGDLRYDAGLGVRLAIPAVAGQSVLRLTWGIPFGHGEAPLGDSVFAVETATGF